MESVLSNEESDFHLEDGHRDFESDEKMKEGQFLGPREDGLDHRERGRVKL